MNTLGILLIAAIAGSAFQSWTVFVVVAAALACGAIYGGGRNRGAVSKHVSCILSAPGLLVTGADGRKSLPRPRELAFF